MNNNHIIENGKGHGVIPESAPHSLTHIKNFLNIATHNVQGLSSTIKQQQFNAFISNSNYDIIGVSETKLSQKNAQYLLKNVNNTEYTSWWDSSGKQQGSGVGLLISKSLATHVRKCKSYKGRIIYVDLFFKGKSRLRIIQFYNHADANHKEDNIELYKMLYEYITEANNMKFYIIIMGDFNIKHCELDYSPYRKSKKKIPLWRKKVLSFLNNHQFTDLGAYLHKFPSNTWIHPIYASRIDYIFISKNLLLDVISFDTIDPICYSSDHRIISCIIDTSNIFHELSMAQAKRKNITRTMYLYDKMTPESWLLYSNATDSQTKKHELLMATRIPSSQRNLNKVWNSLRDIIINAAKENIPKVKTIGKSKSTIPPFLMHSNADLKFVAGIKMKLSQKKIDTGTTNLSHDNWPRFSRKLIEITKRYKIDTTIPADLRSTSLNELKTTVNELYNTMSIVNTKHQQQYKDYTMKTFIEKRCDDYRNDKHAMLTSALSRSRRTIVLDRIVINQAQGPILITEGDKIAIHVNNHFQTIAGGRHGPVTLPPRWQQQYKPKDEIDSRIYQSLMAPPDLDEWNATIKSLPNDKATGPSNISNEMLKHLGVHTNHALWQLARMCFTMADIPQEWRQATIYPIPKPMEWEFDLTKTRPITLLECARKAVVKIIAKRLSNILVKHNILKGGNHAGLPGSSTTTPLRIIRNIIEDAKTKNKELWILFQDLSKAYDRVNAHMLKKAMERIKIPGACINLILNLFSNRKNRVITHHGITDPYDVIIGIDQGEVISPLLWCIYYDPLLTEIQQDESLGYTIEHIWQPDITVDSYCNSDIRFTSQAYMDDTTWLAHSKLQLEKTLHIADEFYNINNIQVNKDKSVLLTNNRDVHKNNLPLTISLSFGTSHISITPLKKKESTRVLGVWINLECNLTFVIKQANGDTNRFIKTIKPKRLTDKQMAYIYNHVMMPTISYKTQITILSKKQCEFIIRPFLKLFKKKLLYATTVPDMVLFSTIGYNLEHLYILQIKNQIAYIQQQFNNKQGLGQLSQLRCRQLMYEEWITVSPLSEWTIKPQQRFSSNLLAATLSLLHINNMSIKINDDFITPIKGGFRPIHKIMGENYHNPKIYKNFRRHNILFLSQLTSFDGNKLLQWTDPSIRTPTTRRKYPLFIQKLEQCVLAELLYHRTFPVELRSPPSTIPTCTIPDMWSNRKKEWITVFDTRTNQVIIGRITFKCRVSSIILVEHWRGTPTNNKISPESSGLIMRRCQGCNVNQPSHNPYTVKNRSYNYNCLGRYSAYTAVVFPKNVKKSNDEYILPNSFFQFKQQAIALYQDRLNQQSSYFNMYKDESESDEDDNSDTTREEINDNNRSTNPIE